MVKLAKTGHGPHSSTLVVICVVRLLFVLFYVLFVCKCVLPPGDNPIAVNKYISMTRLSALDSPASLHLEQSNRASFKMCNISCTTVQHITTQDYITTKTLGIYLCCERESILQSWYSRRLKE